MRRDGKGELRSRIKKDAKTSRSECSVLTINVIILDILGGGRGLGAAEILPVCVNQEVDRMAPPGEEWSAG